MLQNFSAPSPEGLGAKFEKSINIGEWSFGPETSSNFEGRKIFTFKRGGKFIKYAVGRDSQGNLEGSEFMVLDNLSGTWENHGARVPEYGEESSNLKIGPVQQLHQAELEAIESHLEEKGINI
jgi:hypothetical protein